MSKLSSGMQLKNNNNSVKPSLNNKKSPVSVLNTNAKKIVKNDSPQGKY